jgi:hypothetical protein
MLPQSPTTCSLSFRTSSTATEGWYRPCWEPILSYTIQVQYVFDFRWRILNELWLLIWTCNMQWLSDKVLAIIIIIIKFILKHIVIFFYL